MGRHAYLVFPALSVTLSVAIILLAPEPDSPLAVVSYLSLAVIALAAIFMMVNGPTTPVTLSTVEREELRIRRARGESTDELARMVLRHHPGTTPQAALRAVEKL
ncbi:hypothetical protein [Corynebacterium tapiri]|uniref:Uncharacterized protein n=1 Tax=Corynebacterium tapiri TaxID=1448266 RepID=A0A5C4U5M0_9CORY|nr:hypothetical protein [Corynebacterium tapiri]TNL99689.1 hypothetical protein FHE74_01200 [Corynebacterium tapiri]